MILRATDGIRGELIDLDTGRTIPKVIWADLNSGVFEAYQVWPNGEIKTDERGDYLTYRAVGRLKFVPGNSVKPPPPEPAPNPLPKEVKRTGRRILPLVNRPCQHYGCTRTATWLVSDEVPLEPVVWQGVKYERAKNIGIRFYCSWHYEPPRLLDARGEVISTWDEAGGVRPQ